MIPSSRPRISDLYTLSQCKLLENHTLHSDTYLYCSYMAVPPPAPPGHHTEPLPVCFRQTCKKKSRIPCPNFDESRFPGRSQILLPVKTFCVFPNPAPHFSQISNPENTFQTLYQASLFPSPPEQKGKKRAACSQVMYANEFKTKERKI